VISIYDIVVGDIVHLEVGDIISVDGVLIDGYNISCDESDATGESNAIEKVPADVALSRTAQDVLLDDRFDPFILSGAKVLEGVGRFLVTAVGSNSFHGRTLKSTHLLFLSYI
jgi:Ca2+-transporting ATPase